MPNYIEEDQPSGGEEGAESDEEEEEDGGGSDDGGGGGEGGGDSPGGSDDESDDESSELDESIVANRNAKAVERDRAVRRILARSSKNLKTALALKGGATDAEVGTRIRKTLMLLHPDFAINRLASSEEQEKVEAAFKKLNNLRL